MPSQGLQLWSGWTNEALGWTTGQAAMVSNTQYLNIWDDMSQVLRFEGSAGAPRTLRYITGTFKTQLHKEPSTARQHAGEGARGDARRYHRLAGELVVRDVAEGLRRQVLPATRCWRIRWAAPALDSKYLRPNIDPTECCVASTAGSTQYWLLPHERLRQPVPRWRSDAPRLQHHHHRGRGDVGNGGVACDLRAACGDRGLRLPAHPAFCNLQ